MSTRGLKIKNTPEGIAARAAGRRAKLDLLVAEMHAAYVGGASLNELGRRYGRNRAAIRGLFDCRGYAVRSVCTLPPRDANGRIIPAAPATEAEIEAMIQAATRIAVPKALAREWRKWPMERRVDFIGRMRARLASPEDRPRTPFSANVTPFEYGTARAHEICARLNAGKTSRAAGIKVRIGSQGVIYGGVLWFWVPDTGYTSGPHTPGKGRPTLHRTIWQEEHGRSVPPRHCVTFADGNPNNFAPANLVLLSMNENARRNQAAGLLRKSREVTQILLNRSQNHDHAHIDTLHILKGL